MHIVRARLSDFRNVSCAIELHPGVNVFHGRNGQGKTNLLEAVYAAGRGRSFRTSRLTDLVRFGKTQSLVELDIEDSGTCTPLAMTIGQSQRKVSIGGRESCPPAEVSDLLKVVFFGPDEMDIVKGGPGARRAFIDNAIELHYAPYGRLLAAYGRIVRERNQLLRDQAAGRPPPLELMESYEEEVARHGSQILSYRLKYLAQLIPEAEQAMAANTAEGLELSLAYRTTVEPARSDSTPAVLFPLMRAQLQEKRGGDAQLGWTSVGPHQDDLEILLGGKPARMFASQGEQRQAAVALKVAQVAIWRKRFSVSPILLLDDVFSELDPARAGLLLERMSGWEVQTLLTTTDPVDMVQHRGCRGFEVEAGSIRPGETAELRGPPRGEESGRA
jgi:DNA replication and repair protein RecF